MNCTCSCWYCLCTLEGHCGGAKCDKQAFHPEDHPPLTTHPQGSGKIGGS